MPPWRQTAVRCGGSSRAQCSKLGRIGTPTIFKAVHQRLARARGKTQETTQVCAVADVCDDFCASSAHPGGKCTSTAKRPGLWSTGNICTVSTQRVKLPHSETCTMQRSVRPLNLSCARADARERLCGLPEVRMLVGAYLLASKSPHEARGHKVWHASHDCIQTEACAEGSMRLRRRKMSTSHHDARPFSRSRQTATCRVCADARQLGHHRYGEELQQWKGPCALQRFNGLRRRCWRGTGPWVKVARLATAGRSSACCRTAPSRGRDCCTKAVDRMSAPLSAASFVNVQSTRSRVPQLLSAQYTVLHDGGRRREAD